MDASNNISSNLDSDTTFTLESYISALDSQSLKYLTITLYSLVIVFGTFGNSLVLLLVGIYPNLRTLSNAFVVALAVADINTSIAIPMMKIILLTNPAAVMLQVRSNWMLCAIYFLEPLCLTAISLFSLAALSVDRFLAIFFPFRHPGWVTKKSVGVTIIGYYIYSLTSGLAPAYGFEAYAKVGPVFPVCPGVVYSANVLFFILYGVFTPPIITMMVFYGLISYTAFKQARQITAIETTSRSTSAVNIYKSIKVFTLISVLMCLVWGPYIVFTCLMFVYAGFHSSGWMLKVTMILALLGPAMSAANPWIYVLRNNDFYKSLKNLLSRFEKSDFVQGINIIN